MTQQTVTVYSKPNCFPCRITKRELDLRGIQYTEIDVTKDETAAEWVKSLGHLTAPVVAIQDGDTLTTWAGLCPPLIDQHFGKKPTK